MLMLTKAIMIVEAWQIVIIKLTRHLAQPRLFQEVVEQGQRNRC